MAGLRDHKDKAPGGAAAPLCGDSTGNAARSTRTDPNPRCRPGRSWGSRPHGAERSGNRGRGDRVGPLPALPAECSASGPPRGGPPAPPSRLLGDEGQDSGASGTRRAGKGKAPVSKLKGPEFNRRQRDCGRLVLLLLASRPYLQ